jgi:hypothetical protein
MFSRWTVKNITSSRGTLHCRKTLMNSWSVDCTSSTRTPLNKAQKLSTIDGQLILRSERWTMALTWGQVANGSHPLSPEFVRFPDHSLNLSHPFTNLHILSHTVFLYPPFSFFLVWSDSDHFCVSLMHDVKLCSQYSDSRLVKLWQSSEWNQMLTSPATFSLETKVVPIYAMETLGERGEIAPTHSWPWH